MSSSDVLRVAVLGQGSIGRRHVQILLELGCAVTVYDPVDAGVPAQDVEVAGSETEALGSADAALVASPTTEHLRQAALAIEHGCHVLVEKPIAASAHGVEDLLDAAARSGKLVAVAMNLRFHPGPRAVKSLLDRGEVGRPLTAHITCGFYLPEWRPGTDYRAAYSARHDLGGGVLLDVVHELDYARWLLGDVTEVGGWLGHVSDLEIDVEDVAMLHLVFEGGPVASVELDYLDRDYRRGCRIVGSDGTIEWSWQAEEVRTLRPGSGPTRLSTPSDVGPTYREQLACFVASVRESRLLDPLVGGHDGLATMRVVDAARESARTGMRVRLQPSA